MNAVCGFNRAHAVGITAEIKRQNSPSLEISDAPFSISIVSSVLTWELVNSSIFLHPSKMQEDNL